MNKIITLILMLIVNNLFAGINVYVANTGTNNITSGAFATPYKTVTYAATKVTHGDTINVMPGTYTNTTYGTWDIWKTEQTIKINGKTTNTGNYLVIRPYNNGAVKLRGDGDFIVQIRNSSYIKFTGFDIEGEVKNIPLDTAFKYQFVYRQYSQTPPNGTYFDTFRVAFGTPINVIDTMTFTTLTNTVRPTTLNTIGLLVQGSNHIDITNNVIHHNTGTGLRIFQCDYINVLENDIYENSRRSSVGNHGFVCHSATSIDNNDDYKIFIERNNVHNNYNEVYSWSEIKTFITPHIDEGKGISMQKNTIGNGWVHGKILIRNNICHHNGFSGVHVNEGIRIDAINNTCYNNDFSGPAVNCGISVAGGDSIGFYNNITVSPTPVPNQYALSITLCNNCNAENNLVMGNINAGATAIAINTILANPMFVDTIQFKLLASSPAIDASQTNVAVPIIDYYSLARVGVVDRGAVEYFNAILPVSMIDFNLNIQDNKAVKLYWTTASEENNAYFNIEKSKNSFDWEILDKIDSKGNSTNNQNYNLIDYNPFAGTNYYRLKQVDKDGKYSYSKILTALIKKKNNLNIYPNPVSNFLIIETSDYATLKIYSIDGIDVTNKVSISKTSSSTSLNMTNIATGIYFIKLDDNTYRVMKNCH